ncbi:hypothetical protein TPHA_0I02800 [Tetrapisispora phaffii CBS 4417]|uniref:Vacuolar protein sorting-associated protein 51 homolog n=1 Tax=Tetrapisispora phaffii (strain ATCC 24235 / CBS 4417 / NBRC 1672 / NRRL Y-8282 / UCD 70-5) TaxID=1071381 RepID=G8BY03_TETPH|nr:hypothetical protein TPHA_0I02800 [Tetrapisispora phaffii CBS 4417]CCE64781.1 hypothetical protein TPHA_0I02800 [Tetrapisispora phaffii CBS 4417]
MPEQIAHKKSSSVKISNKDKRLLLKEVYKLDDEANGTLSGNDQDGNKNQTSNNNDAVPMNDAKPTAQLTSNDMDSDNDDTLEVENLEGKPLNELEFKDLLHIHNRLLRKETDTNNSIKNVIYDNYYDLIKVNDLLKEMTDDNHTKLEQLRVTLEYITK